MIPLPESLAHDLRSAWRGLRAARRFTAGILGVLALAMGAATVVFSVADAVVLRGLPFDDSHRLVALEHTTGGRVTMKTFAAPDFLALDPARTRSRHWRRSPIAR